MFVPSTAAFLTKEHCQRRWVAELAQGPLRTTWTRLLGQGARIEEIVRHSFIDACMARRYVFWLKKLLTTAIALRLTDSGWATQRVLDATLERS